MGLFILVQLHTHNWQLTSTTSIEKCCLEAHCTHIFEVLIYCQINGIAMIRISIRQREKVCGAHKEVAVERVETETCRGVEKRKTVTCKRHI